MVKKIKHFNRKLSEYTQQDIQNLYVSYVDAVVKSQSLRDVLEKQYQLKETKNKTTVLKKIYKTNLELNNLLVELMQMQDKIFLLNNRERDCSCVICDCNNCACPPVPYANETK